MRFLVSMGTDNWVEPMHPRILATQRIRCQRGKGGWLEGKWKEQGKLLPNEVKDQMTR